MKTKNIKKMLACLLAASCLFSSMNTVAFADENIVESNINSDYELYSLYLRNRTSTLSISGTTATCTSTATGYSSVTQIIGDMYLEKYISGEWTAIDAWRMVCMGNSYSNTKTKSGLSSGSYRLRTEFEVKTSSGATETVTAYSGTKYVSSTSSSG